MSRNFASSRAIPSWKIRKEVWKNPFVPVYWGANQRGMSASTELTGWRKALTKFAWLTGFQDGCDVALDDGKVWFIQWANV